MKFDEEYQRLKESLRHIPLQLYKYFDLKELYVKITIDLVPNEHKYSRSLLDHSLHSDGHPEPLEPHANIVDQHNHGWSSRTKFGS